jgi:hypothetical protein
VELKKKAVADAPQPKNPQAKTVQRSKGALREGKAPAKTGVRKSLMPIVQLMQCAPFIGISLITC